MLVQWISTTSSTCSCHQENNKAVMVRFERTAMRSCQNITFSPRNRYDM